MPLRSLGSNQVLLGGMTSPASETAISCSIEVGYIETAQAQSPESTRFSSSSVPRIPPTKSMRDSVFQDGDVETVDGVAVFDGIGGDRQLMPGSVGVDAE